MLIFCFHLSSNGENEIFDLSSVLRRASTAPAATYRQRTCGHSRLPPVGVRVPKERLRVVQHLQVDNDDRGLQHELRLV